MNREGCKMPDENEEVMAMAGHPAEETLVPDAADQLEDYWSRIQEQKITIARAEERNRYLEGRHLNDQETIKMLEKQNRILKDMSITAKQMVDNVSQIIQSKVEKKEEPF